MYTSYRYLQNYFLAKLTVSGLPILKKSIDKLTLRIAMDIDKLFGLNKQGNNNVMKEAAHTRTQAQHSPVHFQLQLDLKQKKYIFQLLLQRNFLFLRNFSHKSGHKVFIKGDPQEFG